MADASFQQATAKSPNACRRRNTGTCALLQNIVRNPVASGQRQKNARLRIIAGKKQAAIKHCALYITHKETAMRQVSYFWRSVFVFATLMGMIGICGCAEKNPVRTEPDYSVYSTLSEKVAAKLEQTRGLAFKRKVTVAIKPRSYYFRKQTNQPPTASQTTQLRCLRNELVQFCVINDSVKHITAEMQDPNGFAGWYEPGTDTFYVCDDVVNPDEIDTFGLESLFAHELTHALQDQHFGFDNIGYSTLATSRTCTDFALAQACLVEGDAQASESLYDLWDSIPASRRSDSLVSFFSFLEDFAQLANPFLDSSGINRFFSYRGLLPYLFGANNIAQVYKQSGWEAINRRYCSQPVQCTAEIFSGTKLTPEIIPNDSLYSLMLKSNKRLIFVSDDNIGVLQLYSLLNTRADWNHVSRGLGWRGDRLLYTIADSVQWGKLAWQVNLETADDASYLWTLLDSTIAQRVLDGVTPTRSIRGDTITFVYPSVMSSYLVRLDRRVCFFDNFGSIGLAAALGALKSPLSSSVLAKQARLPASVFCEPTLKHNVVRKILEEKMARRF